MPELATPRRVASEVTRSNTGQYSHPTVIDGEIAYSESNRIRVARPPPTDAAKPASAGPLPPLDLPAVGRSAAFFDLDKTVIAKSSALAFGRPFYRDGLISRRDVIKGAYAQLMFRIGGGSDEQTMSRTRDYLAELCKG